MKQYYVYILLCSDGSYYTGVTNTIELRLAQHNDGCDLSSYTFKRRPVSLVYQCEFVDIREAIAWEKKVKRWSRIKKEALIKGEFGKLKELAECKNYSVHLSPLKIRYLRYGIRNNLYHVMVRHSSP